MAEAKKATIYIDVDDEITNIIEKVKECPESIVALVLPKRAAVLQSIVNMKLLKRSADTAKKKVVLITSESGLLPLAGAVGVYVARNLQSKPEIPEAPDAMTQPAVIHEDEIESGDDDPVDTGKTVGELAGAAAVGAAAGKASRSKAKSESKPAKSKKGAPKIPNFEKFRGRLFLIIAGVIGLFVFLYWAFFMAPSAKITVVTDTDTINSSITFTPSTDATEVDTEDNVVPAKNAEKQVVESQTVAATGTKDVGDKATGSVTMTARNCTGISTPASVDSGWAVSTNGKTYITQSATNFAFDSISGGCVFFKGTTTIAAQKPGAAYNVGANTTFTVSNRSDVTATGSASGGTDKTVKVVAQSDVDAASKTLASKGEDSAKAELKKQLEDAGYYAIEASFKKGTPATTSSPTVGSEASEAAVTVTTTYTMTGVKQDDLNKLITETTNKEIDTAKQQVVNTGLDQATFTVDGNKITVETVVSTGPRLDVVATTEQIAGKKRGEVEAIIQANPGVKEVRIDYSPFWVTTTPKKTEKIQILFEDAGDEQQ